jgi:uncharacterized oxidoreductase
MKLEDKTILITGGTSGIGMELARQLLAAGNTVLITGRDSERIQKATQSLKGVHAFQSDASDPVDIAALHRQIIANFPALSVVINNAGIMRNLDLNAAAEPVDITREVAVGLNGPILMNQQFLPHLRKQREALIVNVSSGLALIPFTISPIYSAAKAGLHAYTRCLRTQMKGSAVKVVELLPPGTETPLFRGEFEKEMQGQKGMDVAVLVRQAIAGIEAGRDEIRPGLARVLGVMSRLAPDFMMAQMTRMSAPKS